jgi:hypothetical protein
LAGGWLTAGPDGEQFRVTAFVPYGLHAEAGGTEAGAAGAVENVEPSAEPLEAAPLEAAALEAAPLEAAEPEGARPEAAVRG